MGLLRFLFGRRPDADEYEDEGADPIVAVLEAVDHLNSLVPSLPRGISLWIDYTPGPTKGTIILRRRTFSEAEQVYPAPGADHFASVAAIRRASDASESAAAPKGQGRGRRTRDSAR